MPSSPPEGPQYLERVTLFITFFLMFLNVDVSFKVAMGPATDFEAAMALLFSIAVLISTSVSHLLVKFPRRTARGYPTPFDCAIMLSAGLMGIYIGSKVTLQREQAEYGLSETGDFSESVEKKDAESIVIIPTGMSNPEEGAGTLFFV